jgi:hypothetical protein
MTWMGKAASSAEVGGDGSGDNRDRDGLGDTLDRDARAGARAWVGDNRSKDGEDGGAGSLMGACVAQPHDPRAREWLATAAGKSAADAAVTARRWLTDVLRQERLVPSPGLPQGKKGVAVTSLELRGLAAPLMADARLALRHRALLQVTATAAAAVGNNEADNRRRSALACVIRDAASVAAAGLGDGAAAAAAAQALASCVRDLYAAGRPAAGAVSEAASLVVAGYVVAGEAAAVEGTAGGDEADGRYEECGGGGSPLSYSEESLVREALVDAVLAPPASLGASHWVSGLGHRPYGPDTSSGHGPHGSLVDRGQYLWLGEVGERVADMLDAAAAASRTAAAAASVSAAMSTVASSGGGDGHSIEGVTAMATGEGAVATAPSAVAEAAAEAMGTSRDREGGDGVDTSSDDDDDDWDSWLDDDNSAAAAKKKSEARRSNKAVAAASVATRTATHWTTGATSAPHSQSSEAEVTAAAAALAGSSSATITDINANAEAAAEADYDFAALKLEVRDQVAMFLKSLGPLGNARRGLKSAGALLGDGDGLPEPVLRELAGRIGAGADDAGVGSDLFHAVSSLGGLLKSGIGGAIGRFGFKAVGKPKPSDHSLVIIFVVGGITPGELKEVTAAAAEVATAADEGRGGGGKTRDIIVGGTGLLADHDILRMIVAGN